MIAKSFQFRIFVNTKQKPNQIFGWVAQMVLPIFARQDNREKVIKISLFFGRRNASPTRDFYVFPMDGNDCKIFLFCFFNGAHRTNDQRTIYQFVRRGGVPPPASNDCDGGNGQKNYCPLFSGGATPPLQGIFMFSQWTGNNKLRLV